MNAISVGRQPDVERQQHRAHLHHAVVGFKQFVAVVAEPRDPLASLDAHADQRVGQAIARSPNSR